MFFKQTLLILLLTPLISLSSTLGRHWTINKDHSEVLFEIPYLKFGKVTGRFTHFRGSVQYDKDETLIQKISIIVFTDSIDTGNKLRDGHLRSKDFFNVTKFPKISFESNTITPIGPDQFRASGFVSMHGIKKEINLFFSLSEIITDTWGKPSVMGTFSGRLDRRDFGLTWNKFIEKEAYLVGNKIKFYGQVQLQSRRALTDSSKHLIPVNKSLKTRNKILRGEETIESINRGIIELKSENNNQQQRENKNNKTQDQRSTAWWSAYFSMGFIGFLSIITLMFQGKQFFISIFQNEYEETGKWGFISDIIVYSVGLVYVWAMWIIGFGQ